MMILDGKKTAAKIKEELRLEIEVLEKSGVKPGLAVLLCGNDPASGIYVRNKKKMAEDLGLHSLVIELKEEASEEEILLKIKELNEDRNIHGILVQLPLPKHISQEKVILAIDPKKDVDCFHPENLGRVLTGGATVFPCTPAGVIELLRYNDVEIVGKDCLVIGRSNIVGKPMGIMLLENGATITIAHSKTVDLRKYSLEADVIVVAVGKPKMITADMVKEEAVIIDVGINRLPDGKICGDVDYENVKNKVSAITPVPGGVGPMTIMMLMKNTISAARRFDSINSK